jgi:hypothetical protein
MFFGGFLVFSFFYLKSTRRNGAYKTCLLTAFEVKVHLVLFGSWKQGMEREKSVLKIGAVE